MLWIGTAAVLIAAVLIAVVVIAKRPIDELGSVSARWVAEHRAEQ